MARVGLMMLKDGRAQSGRVVVPADWVRDTRNNGDGSAWKKGEFATLYPAGSYRSYWYQSGDEERSFCAIGIHGQWIYCNPAAGTVINPMITDKDVKSVSGGKLSRIVGVSVVFSPLGSSWT